MKVLSISFLAILFGVFYKEAYAHFGVKGSKNGFLFNFNIGKSSSKYQWKYSGYEKISIDLGSTGKWPFAFWPKINPWGGKHHNIIINWFNNQGKTDVITKDLSEVIHVSLNIDDPESIEYILSAAINFLNLNILGKTTVSYYNPTSILSSKFSHFPWSRYFEAMQLLFSTILVSTEDRKPSVNLLIEILVKKLTIMNKGLIYKDTFTFNKIEHSMTHLGETLHSVLIKRFKNWHPYSTQWLLNILLRNLLQDEKFNEVMDREDFPDNVLTIYPDAKNEKSLYVVILKLLREIFQGSSQTLPKPYLKMLQYIKSTMEKNVMDLLKIKIVKWVYYRDLFFAVGSDNNVITIMDPLKYGDYTPYATGWLNSNGDKFPLIKSKEPWPVDHYPEEIYKWIIIGDYYVPLGNDGLPVKNFEPVKAGRKHLLINKWIKVNGIDTPIGLTDNIFPVEKFPYKVKKWIILNERYTPVGIDDKPIPNINPVKPNEKCVFIIRWENQLGIPVPIGLDGKPIKVEDEIQSPKTVAIVKWLVINNKYYAFGSTNTRIPDIPGLFPQEKHPWIIKWIKKDGIDVPIQKNANPAPVIKIVKWSFENNHLIALGDDSKPVKGIEPISIGEKNVYIVWKNVDGKIKPFDFEGSIIPIEKKTIKIKKWILSNGKYIALDENDKPILDIKPLSPGDNNNHIKKWIFQDGFPVPVNSDNEVYPVIVIVKWEYINNKLVAKDVNDNPIKELKPVDIGENNIFVLWKNINGDLKPFDSDGVLLQTEIKTQHTKITIIKWVFVNGKFVPLGENNEPIAETMPVEPGEKNPLIKDWSTDKNGNLVPVNLDGSIKTIVKVSFWEKENGKLVAKNSKGKTVNEIEPILPGMPNIYITWKFINGQFEPFDKNGNPIKTQNPLILTPSNEKKNVIIKCLLVNGKYYPVNENNELIPNIDPVLPGELNSLIKDWTFDNGIPKPINSNGKTTPVTVIVKWSFKGGMLIPKDSNDKAIEEIQPIKPGEKSPFVVWKLVGGEIKPFDHNDDPLYQPITTTSTPPKKIKIVRWLIINGDFIPIGEDDKPLSKKPIKPGESSEFIKEWIQQNDLNLPIEPQGNIPSEVITVKWIYENGKLIAKDSHDQNVPGLKPLSPGENSPFVTWVIIAGEKIPVDINNQALNPQLPVETEKDITIIKIIIKDGKFIPVGVDEKPLPSVEPIAPGSTNPYFIWKKISGSYIPMRKDGSTIPTEEIESVTKWVVVKDKYVPVDSKGKPLKSIKPVSEDEINDLIFKWVYINGKKVPANSDGKPMNVDFPTFEIARWVIINGLYVPLDIELHVISEINPIAPGEITPYSLSWFDFEGTMIPIGPDNQAIVLFLPAYTVTNWHIVDGKYILYGADGKPAPGIKPLFPGEKNQFVISWAMINGIQRPISPGMAMLPVEEEKIMIINWTLDKEIYKAYDSKGMEIILKFSKYGASSQPNDDDLQQLMRSFIRKKSQAIYLWMTAILMALQTIDPNSESLRNEDILAAPAEVLNKFPLPETRDNVNLMQWLQLVILNTFSKISGVDQRILFYSYTAINNLNKIINRDLKSSIRTHIIIINGEEIKLDENGIPIGVTDLDPETLNQLKVKGIFRLLQTHESHYITSKGQKTIYYFEE